MKRGLMAVGAALALLAPSAAAAAQVEANAQGSRVAVARVVEIRVSGDPAALSRVQLTARELLRRLDVEPRVVAADAPEIGPGEALPLVVAYIDLRSVDSPSIDIEDGVTRMELTRRSLTEVTSLETGVEALLHVLYLTVESTLQVGEAAPAVERAAPGSSTAKPPRAGPQRSPLGFDVGPLLRLSSLGAGRIVPGGGIQLEPRADVGTSRLGLLLSGAVHGASELTFGSGVADVRLWQLRAGPTFDWRLASEVSAVIGFAGGFDAFVVEAVQAPEVGNALGGQTQFDPMLAGLLGARLALSKRVFLSALASLDVDLAPSSFVAHSAQGNETIWALPRLRAGFTLALSFTAAGSPRFAPARREP